MSYSSFCFKKILISLTKIATKKVYQVIYFPKNHLFLPHHKIFPQQNLQFFSQLVFSLKITFLPFSQENKLFILNVFKTLAAGLADLGYKIVTGRKQFNYSHLSFSRKMLTHT